MSQLQVTGEAKIRDIQGPVVANSGVITALDGAASQYVRGDGTLADFPTSSGGGSSVSYYLNSSVSQGTIGGVAYRELSKDPIIGGGTDIAISSNGYVASYITDVNDPDVTIVPGGNFNCEFYFSVNNNTGNPTTYAELYKYDGTTFTLLGSSVGVPEYINQGTIIAPYYFAIPVPTSALALTDRLAIRIYVNVDSRTVTLHTENGHLCQVVTTLSKGMVSLNNLTDQSQFLTTGTAGTNFAIVSSGDTHTFNLPVASATNTGKLSSTDWSIFNGKVSYTGATANVDLGVYSLSAGELNIKKFGANTSAINFEQATGTSIAGAGYTSIGPIGIDGVTFFFGGATNSLTFKNNLLTSSRTYSLPDLSGTLALLEGTQTFSGYKTFDAALELKYNIIPTPSSVGNSGIGSNGIGITITTKPVSAVYNNNLYFASASNTFTFPNASGTIALTSDLGGYVTLATTQTISGAKTFSLDILVNGLTIGRGGGAYSLNTTVGVSALLANTTGGPNTAIGGNALYTNTTGNNNTGVGQGALYYNISGSLNSGFGQGALGNQTTGNGNTGLGYNAGASITTGSYNIEIGYSAGGSGNATGSYNTIIGSQLTGLSATLANNIILADGQGNIRYRYDGTNNNLYGNVNFSSTIGNGTYTYTLPSATGTLALTSDLSGYVPTSRTLTINGTAFNLSANRSWDVGTVTSVTASAGSLGTDVSANVTAGTTTPLITINIPIASATNTGKLTNTDWTTFNNKQAALTNPITGTGTANTIAKFSGTSTLVDSLIKDDGTNVSVGYTTNPSIYLFDVNGEARFTDDFIVTGATANRKITVKTSGTAGIQLQDQRATTGKTWIIDNGTTAGLLGFYESAAAKFSLTTAGNGTFAGTITATGGTLTGALSGTSATFSSSVTAGGDVTSRTSLNAYTLSNVEPYIFLARNSGSNGIGVIRTLDGGVLAFDNGATGASQSTKLTIAANGAATFSSTSNVPILIKSSSGSNTSYLYSANAGSSSDYQVAFGSAGDDANIVAGGSTRLTIASTGAATFSSSIDVATNARFRSASNWMQFEENALSSLNNDGAHIRSVVSADIAPTYSWKGDQDTGMYTPSANTIAYATGGTERMRITSAGNVGIGTSSPARLLDVNGTMRIADGSAIEWGGVSAAISGTSSSNALLFYTSSAERMRITSGGIVEINRTSDLGNGYLEVDGSASRSAIACNQISTASSAQIYFSNPNGIVGSIFTSGSVTAFNVTSDYRLKQDLKDYKGLDLVSKIKTYDYEWKLDKSRMYGVIAHELQEVIPYAVQGEKDGKEMQQVDYSKIVPILVKSIQELEARIKQLENK